MTCLPLWIPLVPAWMRRLFGSDEEAKTAHRDLEEKLTKLVVEDNLLGSAGEFGLLFALLTNKPVAKEIDGEPAVAASRGHVHGQALS